MYEKMRYISDSTQLAQLLEARHNAVWDDYLVNAQGFFEQELIEKPENAIRRLFILAQTSEQREKLIDGVLEGRAYESDRYSLIVGSINPDRLIFGKMYDPRSVKNPRRAKGITNAIRKVLELFDENVPKYDSIVNPDLITYLGKRSLFEEKLMYKGKWNFKSSKLDDLTTESPFIVHITDHESVKKILK